ncbi:hypothetical protein FDECE_14296 [Fusarium decemcellulare]|nr:hypothetical protein FDECE_14296 [Fusarium decemcellulare]
MAVNDQTSGESSLALGPEDSGYDSEYGCEEFDNFGELEDLYRTPYRSARIVQPEFDKHSLIFAKAYPSAELWKESARDLKKAMRNTNELRKELAKAEEEEKVARDQHNKNKASYREAVTGLEKVCHGILQELERKYQD